MSIDSLLTQFPEVFNKKNYKEFKNLSLMRGFNYLFDEKSTLKQPLKYNETIKLDNKGKVNNNVINEKIDIEFLSNIQSNNKNKDNKKKTKKNINSDSSKKTKHKKHKKH
jgi:hypothetical protein